MTSSPACRVAPMERLTWNVSDVMLAPVLISFAERALTRSARAACASATVASLRAILEPRAVAVIGASRDESNLGRRVFEGFVRKVARVPEVRFIVCRDRQITVSVDRAAGQLYARINNQLSACNRKLFFGEPMSVVIRSDLTPEETRQWLSAPGVHYVRENAGQKNWNSRTLWI